MTYRLRVQFNRLRWFWSMLACHYVKWNECNRLYPFHKSPHLVETGPKWRYILSLTRSLAMDRGTNPILEMPCLNRLSEPIIFQSTFSKNRSIAWYCWKMYDFVYIVGVKNTAIQPSDKYTHARALVCVCLQFNWADRRLRLPWCDHPLSTINGIQISPSQTSQ